VSGSQRWQTVGDGVLRWVGSPVDVNCTLVRGDRLALLVDTGSTREEGLELRSAVEPELEGRELVVVNTHAHYDHCFGNSAFSGSPIYASAGCRTELLRSGPAQRQEAADSCREADPEFAARLRAAPIVPPDHLVAQEVHLDLGGVEARLLVIGRGHTDHDLVVDLPEMGIVLAGDLVEESGPPALEDCYPLSWAGALRRLLDLGEGVIVPGHGEPVGPGFVTRQSQLLRHLGEWCLGELGAGPRISERPRALTPAALEVALARARVELGTRSAPASPAR
jgi:glyoxylase-like metal-dependent hydrolase (beta-lactamase superfamily II)